MEGEGSMRRSRLRRGYVRRRIVFYLVTLWVAVTINFVIPRLMPGNAVDALFIRMHGKLSPSLMRPLEVEFGIHLHEGMLQEYWHYLVNLSHGDLGISITYFPTPVSTVLGTALPWTLGLVGTATVIAFVLGTWVGIIIGWRRTSVWDSVVPPVAMFTSAFPYFFFGLLLLYVFGFLLGWFPIGGAFGFGNPPRLSISSILDIVYHAFLPALAMVATLIGTWILTMRNNMIAVLREDYVLMAVAAGLPEREVLHRYVVRNAILPSLTGFAMALGFVVGGAILTEIVFSYPGVGYVMLQAVENQDYPLLQAILLVISVGVLLANFAVDMLYGRLDPRASSQGV